MRRPSGGRGSNQYVTRGQSAQPRASTADLRAVLETEAIGWAFDDNTSDDGRWSHMAKVSRTEDDHLVLAGHPDLKVRKQLAENKKASTEVLELLAVDSESAVRLTAFRNPNLTSEGIARLSRSDDVDVRRLAAESDRIPVDALVGLSTDEDRRVREQVARNPLCPSETLQAMHDADPDAVEVLYNPNCPEPLLRDGIRQGNSAVGAVLRNPKCPPDLIQYLADDGWTNSQGEAIASNPNTPAGVLDELAEDYKHSKGWTHITAKALRNPSCSADTLAKFAQAHTSPAGPGKDYRLAVLSNPNVTADIVTGRARDLAVEVRRAAITHPLCSPTAVREAVVWDTAQAVCVLAARRVPEEDIPDLLESVRDPKVHKVLADRLQATRPT